MFNSLRKRSKSGETPDSAKKSSKLAAPPVKLEDHSNTVFCCAFSPAESSTNPIDLATASYDGTTRVWDVAKCATSSSKKTKKVLKGSTSGVWCCAYSQDASVLVAGCSKGSICVYNATKGKYDMLARQDSSHGASAVFACSMGRDMLLATGGGDNKIKLWALASSGAPSAPMMKAELLGHSGDVVACTFRPSTSIVASGSEDRHVRLWDVTTQECLQILIGHTAEVCSATYNQEGTLLATGSSDKTVRLWDARQKNRCIQTLAGHTASVYSCAFRKGGRYELLASASQDGSVVLWDPRTWKCCQVLRSHHGEVVGLAWHPHGTFMATGSADMTVNLHAIRDNAPEDTDFVEVQNEKFAAESGIFVQLDAPSSGPPSGGPAQSSTPKVMEVSADHLSPAGDSGAPSEFPVPGRAHLGNEAASREEAQVGEATRRELEGELDRQRDLLEKAMVEKRSGLAGEKKADAEDVEELKALLIAFYTKVNPSKLGNVDTIVNDYALRGGGGQEREALNEDLRTVYQCDLSMVQHAVSSPSKLHVSALSVSDPPPVFEDAQGPSAHGQTAEEDDGQDDAGFVDLDEPTDIPGLQDE